MSGLVGTMGYMLAAVGLLLAILIGLWACAAVIREIHGIVSEEK